MTSSTKPAETRAPAHPTLILSEDDVRRSMPMAMAIDVNAQAFREMTTGEAVVPDRVMLPVDEYDGMTLFKPSMTSDALGLKIVSVRPKNDEHGLPTVPATIMLMDKETGLPLSIMGGTYLTAMRTAAGSGVATRILARQNVQVLTVFGAGMQAEQHVHAVLCVRPSIQRVHIVNRTAPRALSLITALQPLYPRVTFNVVVADGQGDGVESATREADIICTTTNTTQPLFAGEWLTPGVHLNCVGSYTPRMQEVHESVIQRCTRVVVDTVNAVDECGDLLVPVSLAMVKAEDIHTLGELLVDQSASVYSRRVSEDDITLFKSVGVAVQDVATAYAVFNEARDHMLGTLINL